MDLLTVGVVGLGLGRYHVAAYTAADSVTRLVICDENADRIREIRTEFPEIEEAYSSIETMLNAEKLDAVSIVTPDHLHRPHTELCFEAGCNVLLTKPLATNLEDGRAIVKASKASGKVLMVAHERRFRSGVRMMKAILEGGDLGDIVHLRVDAIQDKRAQFQRSPWYASAEAGRTALVGSGIHEVDLVRHLIGKPIESVSAYSNRLGTLKFPKDKTTAAIFQFEGGAIGQVTVTYEAHWPRGSRADDHFRLVGTQGMILGDRVGRVGRDGLEGWEILESDESETAAGSEGCVNAFLETLIGGTAVAISGGDAFASLAACVAADTSAANDGKPMVPEELA